MITRPWQSCKERLAILLQFLVLVDDDLVHNLFEDEQLGESANATAVCSDVTNQKLHLVVKSLRLYPMQAALQVSLRWRSSSLK